MPRPVLLLTRTPGLHAFSNADAQLHYAAYLLATCYFTARARSSGPRPGGLRTAPFEEAVRRPDCEGLEPRFGLEGCRDFGRSHGQLIFIISYGLLTGLLDLLYDDRPRSFQEGRDR